MSTPPLPSLQNPDARRGHVLAGGREQERPRLRGAGPHRAGRGAHQLTYVPQPLRPKLTYVPQPLGPKLRYICSSP